MVGRSVGRYRIVASLGAGGMATVWRAEDTVGGGVVALKVLNESLAADEGARRRFLREAEIGASLQHPAIAGVLDFGDADGATYIAFACIEGSTLTQYASRGPLETGEIVRIGIAVGEALAHAEARGVVHRDVTGRNIMIAQDGRVFVLDFGLALARDRTRLTSAGTTLGTAGYMAPEVARNQPADGRSDLYGLGVVLYEAATGSLPFSGPRVEAVLHATLHGNLEPPGRRRTDLPPELERIILRAMARDPAERYQTAAELVADLRGVPLSPESAPAARGADEPAIDADDTASIPSPLYLGVLPFTSADAESGSNDEAARIALGLSDSVAAALGGLESVHVLPPDLARAASGDDPRRIARQIGANLLLRGSVRLTRTRLRVSYSLFHPYRGVQVAAQTLEATRAELFLLEDRMVAGIVQRIGQAKPAGRPPTRPDPAARERYLQALGDLLRYDYEPSVDSAIRILESLSAGDPQNATYAAALGRAYLYKYRLTIHGGWDNRAAQACHRALTLAPDAPDVLQCLGELHLSVGRTDDAVRELEAVVRARPESAGDYSALARAYRAAGRMDEAERMCRRAIALQPEYWGHRNALGRLLYHQGRFQEAADAWREMTRLSPDSAMGYRNLASALFRLDRLEESVENYRRSIRIEPVSRTYSDMGGALYWLGRYDEALEALRTCVSLREADPVAWGNLGSAYRWTPGYEGLAAEPLDRAIGLMRQHLDRHPGNAEDWANLASWLANRDRHAEAAQAAEHAVTLPSLDVNSMAMVGSVFHVLGRPSEALRWLAEAVDRGYGITRLERNPALQGLQGDPRFTRILDTARSRAGGASPATGGEQHGREEGERKDR